MFLFVSVIKDILEIHFQAATDHQQQLQDQKLLIPADQVLVESMLSVEKEMELLPVSASLVFKVIHMLSVNMSAPSIQSVPLTLLASPTNVETHVLECVELMQPAMSTITSHHAPVILVTLETPSQLVTESLQDPLKLIE